MEILKKGLMLNRHTYTYAFLLATPFICWMTFMGEKICTLKRLNFSVFSYNTENYNENQ